MERTGYRARRSRRVDQSTLLFDRAPERQRTPRDRLAAGALRWLLVQSASANSLPGARDGRLAPKSTQPRSWHHLAQAARRQKDGQVEVLDDITGVASARRHSPLRQLTRTRQPGERADSRGL